MEARETLISYMKRKGAEIDGLSPTKILDKGVGMVAERDIREGERLMFVPRDMLITVSVLHRSEVDQKLLKGLSVHGQLAAQLMFPNLFPAGIDNEFLDMWKSSMPTSSEMDCSMPACWPAVLTTCMPRVKPYDGDTFSGSPEQLHPKMLKDRDAIVPYLRLEYPLRNELELESDFVYGWLIVNSRSFYWDYPRKAPPSKKRKANGKPTNKVTPTEDCMCLCPGIDYFNHSNDDECKVSYNGAGYTVTATRDFKKGEELTVSYGKHSNDFLLTEYGFLFNNPSDSVLLDDAILQNGFMDQQRRQLLKEANLFGDYRLSAPVEDAIDDADSTLIPHKSISICHRTVCILSLIKTQCAVGAHGSYDFERALARIWTIDATNQSGLNSNVSEVLTKYLRETVQPRKRILQAENLREFIHEHSRYQEERTNTGVEQYGFAELSKACSHRNKSSTPCESCITKLIKSRLSCGYSASQRQPSFPDAADLQVFDAARSTLLIRWQQIERMVIGTLSTIDHSKAG